MTEALPPADARPPRFCGAPAVNRCEEGASGVEYGLVVALIAAIVIIGVTRLGAVTGTWLFDRSVTCVTQQVPDC